jgi:hypothetical protein
MDDSAPLRLTIGTAAFRAIASAVMETEIGGDVSSVTLSQLRPDLQLMEGAIGVEVVSGEGASRRRTTWIVAGEGEIVAQLEDPTEPDEQDNDGDGDADTTTEDGPGS